MVNETSGLELTVSLQMQNHCRIQTATLHHQTLRVTFSCHTQYIWYLLFPLVCHIWYI